MQAVYAKVDGRALAGLDDLVVKLLLHLSHNLLDARRMDAPVGYKLVKGKAANLAADWVEGGNYDSLRRVVNYNLDASGSLKGAYVAYSNAFTCMKDCPLSSSAPRAQICSSRISGSKGSLFQSSRGSAGITS